MQNTDFWAGTRNRPNVKTTNEDHKDFFQVMKVMVKKVIKTPLSRFNDEQASRGFDKNYSSNLAANAFKIARYILIPSFNNLDVEN
jgi:hypothetical protein